MDTLAKAVVVGDGKGEVFEVCVASELAWLAGGQGHSLQATFRNDSDQPVRLRRVILANWQIDCAGASGQWHLSTLGDAHDAGLPGAGAERVFTDTFGIYPQTESLTLQVRQANQCVAALSGPGLFIGAAGGEDGPQADVQIRCRFDGSSCFSIWISSEHSDVTVAPGASCASETVWLMHAPWLEAVDRLMERLSWTHGSRLCRRPVFGWCSWYHKATLISAGDILDCANDVIRRRAALPLEVIQVDDGFQRAFGDWRLNEKFAEGWPPIIERIQEAGAEPGIWLAPVCVDPASPVYDEHPEWFQHDVQGVIIGATGERRHLDPTHPGARAFIRELIREHVGHGFRYFKFDFNNLHENTRFHDTGKTRIRALRELFQLYRETIGEDATMLACMCRFTRAVAGIADAVRIGVDSMAVWQETHGICVSRCVQAVGATAAANGVLFVNDPDVTYTWPHRLRDGEWRTWHSFVGLLGGTAMISEPLFVGAQCLGHARCHLEEGHLHVHVDIHDNAPVENTAMPWDGSCVEVFVDEGDTGVRQYFLLASGALHSRDGQIVPAPDVTFTRTARPGGYVLEAAIPVVVRDEGVRAEVRVYTTVDPRYGLAYASLFGSRMPYQNTDSYGWVRRGAVMEGELTLPDIGATSRMFEILHPPLPRGARSFDGGRDAWHQRFGYVLEQTANLLVWNAASQTADMPLAVEQAGQLGERFHVWSFWDERYHGVCGTDFIVEGLGTHEAALLRLTALDSGPLVVGSTLHITMGEAEVAGTDRHGAQWTLFLTDAGARAGRLFIVYDGDLVLQYADGLEVDAVERRSNLWVVGVSQRSGLPQSLTFTV